MLSLPLSDWLYILSFMYLDFQGFLIKETVIPTVAVRMSVMDGSYGAAIPTVPMGMTTAATSHVI